jgi:uncharacterized membrane protein YbaN (DUF454 family)
VNAFRIFGFLALAFGILGVFLPILPTTPFILLAAACFARSSEKWHQWLLENKTFGPMIVSWEKNKCISCKVKLMAITSMVLVGTVSIFFAVESHAGRLVGCFFIVLGLITVSLIRTCGNSSG